MSEDEDYSGLVDAYIVIVGATKEYIDALIASAAPGNQRRYAAAVAGKWDGFVATTQQGLNEVEDVAAGLRTNPTTYTYIGHYPPPGQSLKWSKSFPFEAIVEVNVQSGYDTRSVADELNGKDWCEGVCVVAAPFDIVIGVGADTFGGLNEALDAVHEVDGVKSKTSHYVLRSSEHPEGPPPIEE
jgi:hypothetical protein